MTGRRRTVGAVVDPGASQAATAQRAGRHPILVYSLLRLGLLLVVWVPLQFLTPLRGVLAIVVALLLSGVLSYLLLDRQRDAMSTVVGRVFSRIDERIERGKAAEDDGPADADGAVPMDVDEAAEPPAASAGEPVAEADEQPGRQ